MTNQNDKRRAGNSGVFFASTHTPAIHHTHSNAQGQVSSHPVTMGHKRHATPEPTPLKLTRSTRRQIYTADLVFAMTTCLHGAVPKKTKDVLARIQTRVDNINKTLYGGGRFVLSMRDYKKYNRIIEQIKKMIMDISDDDMLSPDFFNAVMMLVEDAFDSVKQSKNQRLKHEWAMLRQSMATFCKHVLNEPDEYDPDWPGYKYEGFGVALGNKFVGVMMS